MISPLLLAIKQKISEAKRAGLQAPELQYGQPLQDPAQAMQQVYPLPQMGQTKKPEKPDMTGDLDHTEAMHIKTAAQAEMKRLEAIRQLADARAKKAAAMAKQPVKTEAKKLTDSQAFIPAGIAILAKLLGARDEYIQPALGSYYQGVKNQNDQAAQTMDEKNMRDYNAELAQADVGVQNAEDMAKMAGADYTDILNNEQNVELQKTIAERMYGVQGLKNQGEIEKATAKMRFESEMPKNWTPERRMQSFKEAFPDASEDEVKAVGYPEGVKANSASLANQALASLRDYQRTDYYPNRLVTAQNESVAKILMLQKAIEDSNFRDWAERTRLGLDLTKTQIDAAKTVAEQAENVASTLEGDAKRFETEAGDLAPKIAEADGQITYWTRMYQEKQTPENLAQLDSFKAEKVRLNRQAEEYKQKAAKAAADAKAQRAVASSVREKLPTYQMTEPPARTVTPDTVNQKAVVGSKPKVGGKPSALPGNVPKPKMEWDPELKQWFIVDDGKEVGLPPAKVNVPAKIGKRK